MRKTTGEPTEEDEQVDAEMVDLEWWRNGVPVDAPAWAPTGGEAEDEAEAAE